MPVFAVCRIKNEIYEWYDGKTFDCNFMNVKKYNESELHMALIVKEFYANTRIVEI